MIPAIARALGLGRRRVKLHLEGSQPSVEGILDGRVDGWFVVLNPKLHISADTGAEPVPLMNPIEIDARRVVFVERLG